VPVAVLVDGEHHPPVVREALERLARSEEIAAVLFAARREFWIGIWQTVFAVLAVTLPWPSVVAGAIVAAIGVAYRAIRLRVSRAA